MTTEESIKEHNEVISKLVPIMEQYPHLVGFIMLYNPETRMSACQDNVGKLGRMEMLAEAIANTSRDLMKEQD